MYVVKTHKNSMPCTESSLNIKLPQGLDLLFPLDFFYTCNHELSLYTYKNIQKMLKNTFEELIIEMV